MAQSTPYQILDQSLILVIPTQMVYLQHPVPAPCIVSLPYLAPLFCFSLVLTSYLTTGRTAFVYC